MASFGRYQLVLFLLVLSAQTVLAQAPKDPRGQAEPNTATAYEERITQERINDHYIPYDVLDAVRELDKITSTSSQNAYASQEEDFAVERLFFSFGRWMAVNWSLYDGSRLSAHLKQMGVDQPDGQIELLMRIYHRHLNGKELSIKDLAEAYQSEKAAARLARLSAGEVIDSMVRTEPRPSTGN